MTHTHENPEDAAATADEFEELPPLIDVKGLAERLNVSVKTIYSMRDRKDAPPAIRVGRNLRWDPADVNDWLETKREVPRQQSEDH